MTFRNIASVALILAIVCGGIYWYVSRPTPEERALMSFFDEFRRSDYDEASEYTVGDDFHSMAAATSVRDSDGAEYTIGDYFPANRKAVLQIAIETYVRQHIARWKYLSMETENFTGNVDRALVHFRLEVAVRDYMTGEFIGAVLHEGRLEGNAHMVLEDGEWVVERFELNIFSDEGLKLASYLDMAG